MSLAHQHALWPEMEPDIGIPISAPPVNLPIKSDGSTWPFGGLEMFGYHLLVVDPPWDFENYSDKGTKKGADPHYHVMALNDIRALPVGQLVRGDCLLLLWSTAPMLPQCIATAEGWGFAYKTELVWRKVWASGLPRMGTGYRARSLHEPIVLATIGAPKHTPLLSLFDGVAREHSRKPDELFAMIDERCAGLVPRAELFSRQSRPGWAAWGNETGKFDPRDEPEGKLRMEA